MLHHIIRFVKQKGLSNEKNPQPIKEGGRCYMRVARLSQFSLANAMVGAFGVNTSYQNTCNYSSI